MNRIQALMLLLLSSLVSAPICASLPVDTLGPAHPVAASGYYNLTLNVNFDGATRMGDPITCKAKIAPDSPSIQGLAQEMAPVQWKTVMALVQGNAASCVFRIPISWVITNAPDGAFLSYEIYAVDASRSMFAVTLPEQGFRVAYPPEGGSANVVVNVK